MTVFSSPQAAQREGFHVIDFDSEYGLYVVARDLVRTDGRWVRAVAFARKATKA